MYSVPVTYYKDFSHTGSGTLTEQTTKDIKPLLDDKHNKHRGHVAQLKNGTTSLTVTNSGRTIHCISSENNHFPQITALFMPLNLVSYSLTVPQNSPNCRPLTSI